MYPHPAVAGEAPPVAVEICMVTALVTGVCAMAVNGVPITILAGAMAPPPPVRLAIRSRMLPWGAGFETEQGGR